MRSKCVCGGDSRLDHLTRCYLRLNSRGKRIILKLILSAQRWVSFVQLVEVCRLCRTWHVHVVYYFEAYAVILGPTKHLQKSFSRDN
jgi:hypothetical protein